MSGKTKKNAYGYSSTVCVCVCTRMRLLGCECEVLEWDYFVFGSHSDHKCKYISYKCGTQLRVIINMDTAHMQTLSALTLTAASSR